MTAMFKIDGVEINGRSLPKFFWNADLVYFDGPLVSLYRHEFGLDVMVFWVDSDKVNNRWASIEVSRDNLRGYLNGKTSLKTLILQSESVYFYQTGSRGRRSKITKISTLSFPREYLPDDDSYLYPEIATQDALKLREEVQTSYKLKLDSDDIYMDDLSDIPKNYQQLYAFHYALTHMDREAIASRIRKSVDNWTGGFSAVNLFSGMKNLIPSVHRARVAELQYASPGFIRLELLQTIADEISGAASSFATNASALDVLYKSIYGYFKKEGISGFDSEDSESRIELTPTQTLSVIKYVDQISFQLNMSAYVQKLTDAGVEPMGQIRTFLAYYRRIERLNRYVDRGLLEIPQ